jgi:hypothetical protein
LSRRPGRTPTTEPGLAAGLSLADAGGPPDDAVPAMARLLRAIRDRRRAAARPDAAPGPTPAPSGH